MKTAIEIAEYFLSKDPERKLFTKKLIKQNGRTFYEGNARLNKYLHLAQNVYIAITEEKLFSDDLYAYDNGGVAIEVQKNYGDLWEHSTVPQINKGGAAFLDKMYEILETASLDELIALSHEDAEWIKRHNGYSKAEQRMDSLANAAEYEKQYADIIKMMEQIEDENDIAIIEEAHRESLQNPKTYTHEEVGKLLEYDHLKTEQDGSNVVRQGVDTKMAIRQRLDLLGERAKQRKQILHSQEPLENAQIANQIFDEMKEYVYKQIVEDET